MPSLLRHKCRQSLRLDQSSQQVLVSKLNVTTTPTSSSTIPLSPGLGHSRSTCSNGKHRTRHRSRLSSRSPTASRFFRRKSNASSSHAQVQGAILPVELLLRIFQIGTGVNNEFPVVVSQVCTHWRSIAIRSPELWRRIRPDGRRLLCARRIQRSRGLLLHVGITIPPACSLKTSALINVHFRMGCVLPSIQRWHSLSIKFNEYSPFLWNSVLSGLCAEPSQIASRAPQLESLSLIYPANDDTKEFHLFGDHAPKLRCVTLCGIRLRWSIPLFENLIYLDYTHHGFSTGRAAVQELLDMLSVSRMHLKMLTIRFPQTTEHGSFDAWYPHTYNSVTLPQVQKLALWADGGSMPPTELKMLVAKLKLPSLVALELDAMNNSIVFSRKVVRSLVRPFWGHAGVERVAVGRAWRHSRYTSAFVRSLPRLRIIK